MKSNHKKTLIVILVLVVLSILILSRCTPTQSETLSIESPVSSPISTPATSPTVAPTKEVSTPTPTPTAEVTPPAASNTPSPTTKPSVKPSAIATKTASPTPKKSVKPTSSPSEEVTEPDTTVRNDANGDGLPDYIKPTVTFTNITCEELEDKFVYKYEINFLGGDNYARDAEVRGGFRMELREGKFWFSISEADLRNPRYVGPIIYKINSVKDHSWTYYESKNLSKKNWSGAVERGSRGIQSPLTLSALYTGIGESFPKPDIEFSLCKK
jgi:hypothetical protein